MTGSWELVDGPVGVLRVYATDVPLAPGAPVLLLCHELPVAKGSANDIGRAYPALADRLSHESGWRVVVGTLRGAGGSEGEFSPTGWLEDVGFLARRATAGGGAVWLAGFDLGGCLALRLAASEAAVRGVATFGALSDPAVDASVLLERCRTSGVVRRRGFPRDPEAWAGELAALRPLQAAAALGDRPLLVVHGAEDRQVHVDAGRALVDAGGPAAELRVVPGAGHWLRADPRVVATLVGWLERRR